MSLSTRDSPPAGCPPQNQPSRLKTGPSYPLITLKQEQQEYIRPHTPQPFLPLGLARPSQLPIVHTPQLQMPHQLKSPASKAAPKERKGRTVKRQPPLDTVRYSCHKLTGFHHQRLQDMDLYPKPEDGDIDSYCRRIPYKKHKNDTGRDHFDVYEYRFTAPNVSGENGQWWVMWDYNTGLVRVHDFFACCKPGKTEPGNALGEKYNPGLLGTCANITGGNLDAQGYWVPYEAAKALAAKFCYKIRFALTPIFGNDFPGICLPEDHEDFGKYAIDPTIIARCKQRKAEQLRDEQERTRCEVVAANRISGTSGYATPAESTPDRSTFQITSPQLSSMPGRFFDPVRDDYTAATENQPSEFPSPSGLWSSAEPNTPTPAVHHERPMVPLTPDYYHHHEYAAPEGAMSQRLSDGYLGFVARGGPTATRSPVSHGGRSPQFMLGSPPESLLSGESSHIHRIPQYSYLPPVSSMGEYQPFYPPIQSPMHEHNNAGYRFPSPTAFQRRHESPISQHEANLERGSKRRRVSNQLLSPSMGFFEGLLKEEGGEYADRTHREAIIPTPVNSYARTPLPPLTFSSPSPKEIDTERAMTEAAEGLLDLSRKDTELENPRRDSA